MKFFEKDGKLYKEDKNKITRTNIQGIVTDILGKIGLTMLIAVLVPIVFVNESLKWTLLWVIEPRKNWYEKGLSVWTNDLTRFDWYSDTLNIFLWILSIIIPILVFLVIPSTGNKKLIRLAQIISLYVIITYFIGIM